MTEFIYDDITTNEAHALVEASSWLEEHSFGEVSLPWEGNLDDLEIDRFKGLLAACRAYARAMRLKET